MSDNKREHTAADPTSHQLGYHNTSRNHEKPFMRGLIIHSQHVDKILVGEKTYEIRNTSCQCVNVDEEFYLLRVPPKGKGKNIHGQSVLEVVGTAIFKGYSFIRHEDFAKYHEFHKVSQEQYDHMRKKWKRDTGGCFAWELKLGLIFEPPRYLASGSQDFGALMLQAAFPTRSLLVL